MFDPGWVGRTAKGKTDIPISLLLLRYSTKFSLQSQPCYFFLLKILQWLPTASQVSANTGCTFKALHLMQPPPPVLPPIPPLHILRLQGNSATWCVLSMFTLLHLHSLHSLPRNILLTTIFCSQNPLTFPLLLFIHSFIH